MGTITPGTTAAVLLVYAALLLVMSLHQKRLGGAHARTFVVLGLAWGVSVFIANDLLALAGAMSPLPFVNNFLHAIVWIGGCLSYLYLGVRDDRCWNCGRRNPGMWGFGPALRRLGQDLGFAKLALDPVPILEKYGVKTCLLAKGSPAAHALAYLPGWHEVYADERAVIFTQSAALVSGGP